ncbi:Ig-like domain-containing protein, partial [Weeksellaceae bacterium KMM 9713]
QTQVVGRVDTTGDGIPDTNVSTGTSITLPSGGTLVINPEGSYDYTPAEGFVGTESVVYEVNDQNGATDLATLYLTTLEIPCTIPGAEGTPGATYVGISTLDRNVEEWLIDENQNKLGAYIALESTNKAFVITRMESPETSIGNTVAEGAVEGMVVWDTDENCLKLFKGDAIGWVCTSNQCSQ